MGPVMKRWPFLNIERGDVYLVDLGEERNAFGSEMFGVRHVVVTQCDPRPPSTSTFTIAIITNGVGNSPMEYRVSIPNRRGLPDGSVVLANERRTIDKARIIKYCCHLDSQTMKRISRACRRAEETDKKRHKQRRKHSNTS